MRIALISDIHSNLIALEAMLADIAQVEVDQIIFLGDLVTLGPQPREVVERVRGLGCPCVLAIMMILWNVGRLGVIIE